MSREQFANAEAGGGLAAFEFEVTRAWFAVDAKYSEVSGVDTLFLNWEGKTSLEGQPTMTEHDKFHPSWSLHPDFVTIDGGKSCKDQHGKKDDPAKFKPGKAYFRMLKQVLEATDGVTPDPLDSIDPMVAASWVGTKWYMDQVTADFGAQFGKKDELMPVRYLGGAGMSGSSSGVAVTAAPAPTSTASTLRVQVEALAKTLPDYKSFQTAALALDGIHDDPTLLSDIVNEGAGVWATARS